jgi:ERCC4-type nuclease
VSKKTAKPSKRFLYVDDREKRNARGQEIFSALRFLHLPVDKTRLEFGDAAFIGEGPRGKVMVGVERKTIRDLMNSFVSKRLQTTQLPGMAKAYDYRWLVVEGLWRPSQDNIIEIWRGGGWRPAECRLPYHVIEQFLFSVEVNGGCWVRHTHNIRETALFLSNLFQWWGRTWDEHRSMNVIDKGLPVNRALLVKPTFARTVAATIPGIGWEKSKGVVRRFGTVEKMATAGEKEWMEVPGIGKKLGARIPKLMRGEEQR